MKKPKITSVLVFENGNIAAFDEKDEQVPLLQQFNLNDLILEKAKSLNFNTSETNIKFAWNNFWK